jgi:hypothetical protein
MARWKGGGGERLDRMGLSRPDAHHRTLIRNDGLNHRQRSAIKRRQETAHIARPTRAAIEKRERAIKQAPAPRPEAQPQPRIVLLTGLERVWTERAFAQCAFPVAGEGADTLSCCAPTGGKVYCPAHRKIMYQPRSTMSGHDRKYFAERVA